MANDDKWKLKVADLEAQLVNASRTEAKKLWEEVDALKSEKNQFAQEIDSI